MKRSLHLHVGLPKCGSTALQVFLKQNRAGLLKKGVDYPDLAPGQAGNLTPYTLSTRPDSLRRAYFTEHTDYDFNRTGAALLQAARNSTAPTMVLSSEALFKSAYRPPLDWIFELFDEVSVHIVFRPRARAIVSAYGQSIRAMNTHGPIETMIDQSIGVPDFEFSTQLKFWYKLVGKHRTKVHFLSPDRPDVVTQIMSAIGCDLETGRPEDNWHNRSLPPFVLCVLAHALANGRCQSPQNRHEIIQLASRHDPLPNLTLLTPALALRIDAVFDRDTADFTALQSQISRRDIETDIHTLPPSISFAEIEALPEFRTVVQRFS